MKLLPYAGRLLQFATGVPLRPNTQAFLKHRQFHGINAGSPPRTAKHRNRTVEIG